MNIYVVFSSTPYRIGKLIRGLTHEKYNHISIALDENLTQMYAFARRYYRTPFYGGFVRETRSRYHLNGEAADIRICRLPVTPQQYETLSHTLDDMNKNQEAYPYNHLSVPAALFRHPVKVRDAYTCIEFCVHILLTLGIDLDPGRYYSIGELEQLLHPYTIYTGPMPAAEEYDYDFYASKPVRQPVITTLSSILTLLQRRKAQL